MFVLRLGVWVLGIITGEILLWCGLEAFAAVTREKVVDMAVMDARLGLFSVDGLATYRIHVVGRRNPAQTIGGLSRWGPLAILGLTVPMAHYVSTTAKTHHQEDDFRPKYEVRQFFMADARGR